MLRWCFALLTSDAWVLDSFDGLVDLGKPKKVIPILFKIETVTRDLIKLQAKIANLGHPDITVLGFCPPEKLLPLVLKLRRSEVLGLLCKPFVASDIELVLRIVLHSESFEKNFVEFAQVLVCANLDVANA